MFQQIEVIRDPTLGWLGRHLGRGSSAAEQEMLREGEVLFTRRSISMRRLIYLLKTEFDAVLVDPGRLRPLHQLAVHKNKK